MNIKGTSRPSEESRIFKAGNSLAVRIPSGIARHLKLVDGVRVEVGTSNGTLVIRRTPRRSLQELIDRITPDNIHDEQFSTLVGRERW